MNWFDPLQARGGSIPFALDGAGRWRDVAEVKRGKACGCFCPDCRGALVARKGNVRVHHFAHADQRECRHALEASLFGMAREHLSQPGAVLALPGHGSRSQWLRGAGLRLDAELEAKFLANTWVIAPETVVCTTGFASQIASLHESDPNLPDLVAPDSKLAVHFLSHRKSYEEALAARFDPAWRVLAINLSHYLKRWWSVCDSERAEKIADASTARDDLAQWLGQEISARGFLYHPEEAERRRQFDVWIDGLREGEFRRREAEDRAREEEAARRAAETRRWTIPATIPGATPTSLVFKPVRPDGDLILTSSLAACLHLQPCRPPGTYIFVGRPGQVVPEETRPTLDPETPWALLPDDDPPERPRATARPAPVRSITKTEDRILEAEAGVCVRCGAPTHRVLMGDGLFQGRIVERCSRTSTHPLKIIGRPDCRTP